MNQHSHPVAAPAAPRPPLATPQPAVKGAEPRANTYMLDCSGCEGSGTIVSVLRIAGEAFDADLSEKRCDACEGVGTFELCEFCDSDAPDGYCPQCADDNGQFGVGA